MKKHFSELLNKPNTVNKVAVERIKQNPVVKMAAVEPGCQELVKFIKARDMLHSVRAS